MNAMKSNLKMDKEDYCPVMTVEAGSVGLNYSSPNLCSGAWHRPTRQQQHSVSQLINFCHQQ